jgi:hypothetical protein
MAARIRKSHQDDIRKKIQADRLISWLHAGVFGTKFQGRYVELTPDKVSAAKGLLNKALPDLARTELSGPDGAPLTVEVVRFADTTPGK